MWCSKWNGFQRLGSSERSLSCRSRTDHFTVNSRNRIARGPLALVALMVTVGLGGCTTMSPISLQELASAAPERVRVTTTQDQISIADPRLEGGSLTGELLNERNQRTGLAWSTPVESIVELAVRTRAQGRTAAAVFLGIPAAGIAIFMLAFLAHCDSGDCG